MKLTAKKEYQSAECIATTERAVLYDEAGLYVGTVAADSAQVIVRAVNAHAVLVAALAIATTTLETVYSNDRNNIAAKCCIERNREALALAKGDVRGES